jgi:HEAT repeat protein
MLAGIGPAARAAVPALVQLGKDCSPAMRTAIVRALGEIAAEDRHTVPFLIEQLEQDRHVVAAMQALARFGPRAHAARPRVQMLLKSHDADERSAAMWALAAIAPPAEAIGQLVPMTYDRDANVRAAAAAALCSLGPPEDVLRRLEALLRDDEDSVRSAVARALGDMGPPAFSATTALCALLADDSQAICDTLLEALAKIEP